MPPLPSVALFRREFLRAARNRWYYYGMAVMVVAGIAVIYQTWPRGEVDPFNRIYSATEVFRALAMVVLLVPTFVLTLTAATAVTVEREQDTLDLLRMSYITDRGLLLAKLMQSLLFYLLIVCALLPLVGALFFQFGVDQGEVLELCAVVLVTCFSFTSVGLLCSALARRTWIALFLALLAIASLYGVPLFLGIGLFIFIDQVFFYGFSNFSTPWISDVLQNFAPYAVVGEAVPWMLSTSIVNAPPAYYFWHSVLGVNALLLAARMMRRRQEPRYQEQFKPIDDNEVLDQRRKEFPYYLFDPMKRKPGISDRRNPALEREIRWGLYGRVTFLARVTYVSFIAFLILGALAMAASATSHPWRRSTYPCLLMCLIILAATPPLVAPLIVREREQGNMDMLRMTLLNPYQIIFGKIIAGFSVLLPMLVSMLGALLLLLLFELTTANLLATLPFPVGILMTLVSASFAVAVSLQMSLWAKSTVSAIISSYGVLVSAFVLVYFVWTTLNPSQHSIRWFFAPHMSYVMGDPWAISLSFSLYAILTLLLLGYSTLRFARSGMRDR